ncbi:OmpA family protein [Roseibium aggregatum]|uniref:Outer membrane porin F n=1 Tax=Roseibium aggregatum TaxID=187304 RepID=A0A0M6Y446_9HYPH|nr:OmpA family protein [Roseibium aggregatum]CTQ43580.1 Outer membrane porin F precursor [Roseibium aggregatum]
MTSRLLRNSTAMALVLAIGLPLQPGVPRAQETTVDCAANPDQEACKKQEAAPAEEAPATDAPAEEAPAAEAPATQSPATEAPAAEAPAEEAPAEPAPEEGAVEDVAPEAAQETQAEEPAPAATEPVATEDAQPEAKPTAPVEEAAPAEKPAAPVEETAPVEKPLTAEETTAPEAKPEAPVEEAAPAEETAAEPASEQPVEEQPADAGQADAAESTEPQAEDQPADAVSTEAPAAEEPTAQESTEKSAEETAPAEPAAEEAATDEAGADQKTAEQPQTSEEIAPAVAPVEATAADETVTEEPGEPIAAQATAPAEEPAAVVSDDATEAQRAEIKAKEERRRDEARDRRLELLGAAAVGVGVGMLIPALGGKVVEDQGDRIIVERDGEYFVRKDESSLLRYGDDEFHAERLRGGRTRETVTRTNGVKIITIRDEGGYVLYRSRLLPDGREYVLIDNREYNHRRRNYDRELPPLEVGIPRDRYIVPAGRANYDEIYQTFTAPPVEQVEQAYSLRDIRENERLRDKVRRVDLDTITFDTGSAVVRQSQVSQLEDIARASQALIDQDPTTVLLIEGHTDAVGSDVSNLALSDRRAETVARILADIYGVSPENMVVQGYGEDYLKVDTQGAEERNRRVTIRNITPLLSARR